MECRLVGVSRAAIEARRLIQVAADCAEPVLVWGPTGTGKRLAAEDIHRLSGRSAEPFVTIDCAALSEGLLESELFGHERGAFTGADRPSGGLFLAAGRGTVFIDEIQELGPSRQARLLRVLEEHVVRPLAATEERPVRARIVAAMSMDPVEAVRTKVLRPELYFRLRVICVAVPPLAERPEDIPVLVEHFRIQTERVTGRPLSFTRAALDRLGRYCWPGNVRQIRNLLRSLSFSGSELIDAGDLDPHLESIGTALSEPMRLDDVMARAIGRAITASSGNKTRAAGLLGIRVERLRRLLKRYCPGGLVASRSLSGAL